MPPRKDDFAEPASIAIDIGDGEIDAIADELSDLLAEIETLYLAMQDDDWNVTGRMLNPRPLMFETRCDELALAMDEIAADIRALCHPAPGSSLQ